MFSPSIRDTTLFFSTLIHEFKNPLSAIRAMIQIVEKDAKDNEKVKRYLSKIIKELDRINSILSSVKGISTLEIKPSSKFNLIDIMDEVLSVWKHEMKNRGIDVKFLRNTEIIEVCGDRDEFIQVIVNLIKNAEKSVEEKRDKEIVISANILGKRCILSVKDNGCGIEKERLEKMNKSFKSSATEGLGLGLFIVREIVRSYNGNISIKSKKNKGTEVIIEFPLK